MTREETNEAIKVMSAYANGKKIQYLDDNGRWVNTTNPSFDWRRLNYRINPKPEYRPFNNQEECWQEMQKHQPVGYIMNKERKYITLITEVYTSNITNGLYFRLSNSTQHNNAKDFFKDYKFADGEPFGIKEE